MKQGEQPTVSAYIGVTKSYLNYSLKDCNYTYEKEFDKTKEKYNLKGQVKVVSNIACEYIITLENTINKFIHWICKKFSVSEEDELIRNFEIETNTCLDPEKQINSEEFEREEEMEL